MFDTKFAPAKTPTAKRFMLCCGVKKCTTVRAFDCPMKVEKRWTRGFVGVPGSATSYTVSTPDRNALPELYCVKHHIRLSSREIKGSVTECPCDGRCTSAKGPNCDCSCGGANHGSDYL